MQNYQVEVCFTDIETIEIAADGVSAIDETVIREALDLDPEQKIVDYTITNA